MEDGKRVQRVTDMEIQKVLDRIREVQERYRLPDDLTAEEKKALEFLDTLGYSEADKVIRLQSAREYRKHKKQQNKVE